MNEISDLINRMRARVAAEAAEKEKRKKERLAARAKARKGESGFDPVLEGYEIARTSVTKDAGGKTVRTHITQRPEAGQVYKPPPGFFLKKVTVDIGPDGRINKQWPRYAPDASAVARGIEEIKAIFSEYKGKAELSAPPSFTKDDLATGYVIGDPHFGAYAWGAETGSDYDTEIAEKLHRGAMHDLVASTPPAGRAFVLSLGDFYHTDTSANRTAASSHALDVDTRRTRVNRAGFMVAKDAIELALQKHESVDVKFLPGNHDEETTPWLAIALWSFFHNQPRVNIDCSPSRFWFWQFGRVMIAATHGDRCRAADLPMVMARDRPEMWGSTRFRYALVGHVHHKDKIGKEIGGATVESFQTLAAPDSWHASMGYRAGRSMTAITYHREFGERFRATVTAQQLEEAA